MGISISQTKHGLFFFASFILKDLDDCGYFKTETALANKSKKENKVII